MILLRRVIGDALRTRRQAQQRTLRDVSTAANVSLGYLSEVERGQKEASSELLAAICEALGARLSEVLHEISLTVEGAERLSDPDRDTGLVPAAQVAPAERELVAQEARDLVTQEPVALAPAGPRPGMVSEVIDGEVSVTVRQETPLRATLRATRRRRRDDVLSAA